MVNLRDKITGEITNMKTGKCPNCGANINIDETDIQKKNPTTLIASLGEDHEYMDWKFLEEAGVFHKHYAWRYEKECRLIVELSTENQKKAGDYGFNIIRITLPEAARRALKDRIVRSPVYAGKTDFGKVSTLYGNVDWIL